MNERLRQLIKTIGISQKMFAEKIGVTPAFISDIINGRTKGFSIDTLSEIAIQFKVNINWLLTGEGEMFLTAPAASSKQPPKEKLPPTEINGLGVIEGNVETYPQVDTVEKISRTSWWNTLDTDGKYLVAAIPELPLDARKRLRRAADYELDIFEQQKKEEAEEKARRQKGEAG